MRILTYLLGIVGLGVSILFIAREGIGTLGTVLGSAGWGLLWLVPFHVVPLLPDVIAWRVLLAPRDPERRAGLAYLFWVAAVREAVNRLLPVANIGGEVIGIRLVTFRGLAGAPVVASVVIEVLMTLVNQCLLAALGLIALVRLTGSSGIIEMAFAGVMLSLVVAAMIHLLLMHGSVFERMERGIEAMMGPALAAFVGGANLDAEVRMLQARHLRLLSASAWQMAGYVIGTFEVWFALHLLGSPVSFAAAFALEATTQAVRHFAFVVPAGLGVQEAGLVFFGELLGLPSEVAIALSLVKRLREVLFGLPALLSWQWVEARRLHAALRERNNGSAPTR